MGDQHHEMEYFQRFFRFMQMMKMMNHDDDDHTYTRSSFADQAKPYSQMNQDSDMMMMKEMMNKKDYEYDGYMDNNRRHNEMPKMYNLMKKMGYEDNKNDDYMKSGVDSMFRSMGQMRFKRQAGDSLALNDRLKEKLEHMMEEHVEEISN